jgi:hypothetical protein
VETHPHEQRAGVRPFLVPKSKLPVDCGRDRGLSRGKGGVHTVAGQLDDMPAVVVDGTAQV